MTEEEKIEWQRKYEEHLVRVSLITVDEIIKRTEKMILATEIRSEILAFRRKIEQNARSRFAKDFKQEPDKLVRLK